MKNKLLESVLNCEVKITPWEYFILHNPLTEEQIKEIKTADIDRVNYVNDGTRSGNKSGKGNLNHNVREYIEKDNSKKYPHLIQFIEGLRSKEVREAIASLIKRKDNFKNSYVRLEVLHDQKSFWLEPHCDIKEKLISSLIYINDTNENENLGTDLYNENLELIDTVPFKHNLGYIFSGPNKWHGVEKNKQIKIERRGIQLNYVTFKTDWPV
jgi:hypothetical protein